MEKNKQGFILERLKMLVLRDIFVITAIGASLSVVSNIINNRPISNIIIPFCIIVASTLALGGIKDENKAYKIRLLMMIFLANIYIPLGWLISPGSWSAMPYYAIGILFLTTFLVETKVELFIPIISIIEVVILFNYEVLAPEKFDTYTNLQGRAIDLSINYTIVAFVIIYVLYRITKRSLDRDEQLRILSITDQLTGLYNRRYILEVLAKVHSKPDAEFVLVMLDLNRFKFINDTYGHLVGDRVLSSLGTVLLKASSDIIHVGRYGGDEFMIILEGYSLSGAEKLLEQIKTEVKNIEEKNLNIELEFSMGMCFNQGRSVEEMIHFADRHLYEEKRS